jgi:aminoglycoside phosphotransferase (APT) family kinase protein
MLGDRWICDRTPTERFPDYTRGNAGEVLAEPVSPLAWTFCWEPGPVQGCVDGFEQMGIFDRMEYGDPPESFGLFGGYFYNSLTQSRLFGVRSGAGWQAVDQTFFDSASQQIPPYVEKDWHTNPCKTEKLTTVMGWVTTADSFPEAELQKLEAKALRDSRPDLSTRTDEQLLARAFSIQRHLRVQFSSVVWASMGSSVGPGILPALLGEVEPEAIAKLMTGIGDVDSAGIAARIFDISRLVRSSPELSAEFDGELDGLLERVAGVEAAAQFNAAVEAFMYEHGSRGPNEWDIYQWSYETNPTMLLQAVERARHAPDAADPALSLERGAAERNRLIEKYEAAFADNAEALGGFQAAVKTVGVWMAARERIKSSNIRCHNEVRMCFGELGRRMVERGHLAHPRQIYMLLADELDGVPRRPRVVHGDARRARGRLPLAVRARSAVHRRRIGAAAVGVAASRLGHLRTGPGRRPADRRRRLARHGVGPGAGDARSVRPVEARAGRHHDRPVDRPVVDAAVPRRRRRHHRHRCGRDPRRDRQSRARHPVRPVDRRRHQAHPRRRDDHRRRQPRGRDDRRPALTRRRAPSPAPFCSALASRSDANSPENRRCDLLRPFCSALASLSDADAEQNRRCRVNQTADVAGFDVARVERWLGAETAVRPPCTWERLAGGHSNLTYLLTDTTGRKVVIRRPPQGELLPKAHDMEREWRIISAIHPAGIPVAEPIAFCDDRDVCDRHFYVMGHVDGQALYTAGPTADWLGVEARGRAGGSFMDVLAQLHSLDPAAVGLDDLGRHDGYVARQIKTWYGSWTASADAADYDDARLHALHDHLVANLPEQGPARVVHGDYGVHNAMFDADGRVTAVLDWEIGTLGDPLADFAYALNAWVEPSDSPDAIDVSPTALPGFDSRAALAAHYAERTGADLSRLGYYRAFNSFKTACIIHGVYARYQLGMKSTEGVDLDSLYRRIGDSITTAEAHLAG